MFMENNRVKTFEDLIVYQRAYKASLEIHKVCVSLPEKERYCLEDQMRRASRSICANIAEGFSRQRSSAADYRRYLLMAIGSSDEMRVWLMYCIDLGYMSKDQGQLLRQEYSEVSKMLQGIHSKWQSKNISVS